MAKDKRPYCSKEKVLELIQLIHCKPQATHNNFSQIITFANLKLRDKTLKIIFNNIAPGIIYNTVYYVAHANKTGNI